MLISKEKFDFLAYKMGRRLTGKSVIGAEKVLVEGISQAEASRVVGITRGAVSNTVRKILSRMKELNSLEG